MHGIWGIISSYAVRCSADEIPKHEISPRFYKHLIKCGKAHVETFGTVCWHLEFIQMGLWGWTPLSNYCCCRHYYNFLYFLLHCTSLNSVWMLSNGNFHMAIAGDWLQGPYVYYLYSVYGFGKGEIGQLFIAGFGSSMLFGTIVGSLADKQWGFLLQFLLPSVLLSN